VRTVRTKSSARMPTSIENARAYARATIRELTKINRARSFGRRACHRARRCAAISMRVQARGIYTLEPQPGVAALPNSQAREELSFPLPVL
jgi:hypothetical protein